MMSDVVVNDGSGILPPPPPSTVDPSDPLSRLKRRMDGYREIHDKKSPQYEQTINAFNSQQASDTLILRQRHFENSRLKKPSKKSSSSTINNDKNIGSSSIKRPLEEEQSKLLGPPEPKRRNPGTMDSLPSVKLEPSEIKLEPPTDGIDLNRRKCPSPGPSIDSIKNETSLGVSNKDDTLGELDIKDFIAGAGSEDIMNSAAFKDIISDLRQDLITDFDFDKSGLGDLAGDINGDVKNKNIEPKNERQQQQPLQPNSNIQLSINEYRYPIQGQYQGGINPYQQQQQQHRVMMQQQRLPKSGVHHNRPPNGSIPPTNNHHSKNGGGLIDNNMRRYRMGTPQGGIRGPNPMRHPSMDARTQMMQQQQQMMHHAQIQQHMNQPNNELMNNPHGNHSRQMPQIHNQSQHYNMMQQNQFMMNQQQQQMVRYPGNMQMGPKGGGTTSYQQIPPSGPMMRHPTQMNDQRMYYPMGNNMYSKGANGNMSKPTHGIWQGDPMTNQQHMNSMSIKNCHQQRPQGSSNIQLRNGGSPNTGMHNLNSGSPHNHLQNSSSHNPD